MSVSTKDDVTENDIYMERTGTCNLDTLACCTVFHVESYDDLDGLVLFRKREI